MKKVKSLPCLVLLAIVLSFFISGGHTVCAQQFATLEEEEAFLSQFIEYDHYEDEYGISTYASSFTGKVDNIVVFVRFQDSAEYVDSTSVVNANKTYNLNEDSLKKYLERISYGDMDINTYFFPGNNDNNYYSVQVSHEADYYKKQYTDSSGQLTNGYTTTREHWDREIELISEALRGVQAQLENSGLSLDVNRDGFVDGISFVVPVLGTLDNVGHGDLLWPHKASNLIGDVPIDMGSGNTLYVNTYNVVNKGTNNYGIMGNVGQLSGTVIHEFLHTLSLPDLYRYADQSASPLGPWDIMDGGTSGNITAWYQREYLEFGAKLPIYTQTIKGITLDTAKYQDKNEVYAIILKSPRSADEYFVVENRAIDSGSSGKQLNSGLLVYRIMDGINGPGSSNGNKNGPPDFIYAYRPNEKGLNAGGGDIGYATLSPDNPKGFTSLGKPLGSETPGYDSNTIYYTDGSNSGIVISNLQKGSNGSMTFDVTFPEPMKGAGTQQDPYQIYTVSDFQALSSAAQNTYYKLMQDIDCKGQNFFLISNFKGILDGNNKTIKNLSYSSTATAAFIGALESGAVVRNLNFENPVLKASQSSGYTAIFAEVNGTIENVTVSGGSVSSPGRAGGFAGVLNSTGSISNCYTSAFVKGNEAGGFLSYMSGGKLNNIYACGSVSGSGGNTVTGGLMAQYLANMGGTATNAYWDIEGTGQNSNGLQWENKTPLNLSGCFGLKIDCPSSITQNQTTGAKIVSTGSAPSGNWTSSDPSKIVIQAQNGQMTGKGQGSTEISYQMMIGSLRPVLSKTITCTAGSSGNPDNNSGNSGSSGNNPGGSGNNPGGSGNSGSNPGNSGNSGNSGNNPGGSGNSGNSSGNSSNSGSSGNSGNSSGNSGSSGNSSGNSGNSGNTADGAWIYGSGGWWFRYYDGSYPAGSIQNIDGVNYAFDANGYMITGWYYNGYNWYYFNGSGAMVTGWLLLNDTWYYLHDSGVMATGWLLLGDTWYYLDGSGAMRTGWLLLGDTWYYLDGSGAMRTGWLLLGGTWYYLHDSGAMATGWLLLGNTWYYLDGSGAMRTGWLLLGDTWYYLDGSGAMRTGWLLLGDTWYYLHDSGAMAIGWLLLDNSWYYLDGSGAWLP